MDLDRAYLLDFLGEIATLQADTAFLEKSLSAGLQITRAQSGMIALFDFEEGQEAGQEAQLLRRYLVLQLAQTRNTYTKLGLPLPNINPLGLWLPRTNTIYELPSQIHSDRHVLTIPLCAYNSTSPLGFLLLMLENGPKQTFVLKEPDQTALNAFSRAVANNWLNLRSAVAVKRRVDDLLELTDIVASLTSNHDLPELLQQIMHTTAELLQAENCTLMLLDQNTNELIFQVPDLLNSNQPKEFRQPIERGICGYVARVGKPLIVNDVAQDERFNQQVDQATGFRTRTVICAPMRAKDKTIGVIEGINKLDGEFTSNDLSLLLTLAAQAAIAIENAELYASVTSERDKLIAKEEEVRRELGRDLHDGPAQVISGIAMRIGIIKRLLANEPKKVLPELDELEKVVLNTAKDIRTMMFGLRPLMLETKGLIPTLEAYVEKLQSERWQTHLEVEGFMQPDGSYYRLSHNAENTFFIIIQEAINNIRKHAQPKNVWLKLTYSPKEILVTVQDDGKGFEVEAVMAQYDERGSFGLLNMRERARLVNASYAITSKPGQGTNITLSLRPDERSWLMTGSLSSSLFTSKPF